MQLNKPYIATILLVGFLLPQVVHGMHYLVVPHTFSSEKESAVSKADSNFQYHSSHYHLNTVSTILPAQVFLDNTPYFPNYTKQVFYSLENYVHQPDYDFQLRGPPY